jgi:ADP-sugar diphosphatase
VSLKKSAKITMSIMINNRIIPIVLKYKELEQHLDKILKFPPFVNWQSKINNENTSQIMINKITIQDLDFFGSRIGFLKFNVDATWLDGTSLPGIVYARGPSVAIFLVLDTGEDDPLVVLVRQPRIPIGSMGFLELPAGMLDGSNSFTGVAAQELKEECGIEIQEDDLVSLGELAPSPGGCDEYLHIFKLDLKMSKVEANALNGRIGGLSDHGERICIVLKRKSELYALKSMPILAALALYDRK